MGRRWQREGEEERCIWGRERERASEKGKKEINKMTQNEFAAEKVPKILPW